MILGIMPSSFDQQGFEYCQGDIRRLNLQNDADYSNPVINDEHRRVADAKRLC